jgi:hypothetical protein
MNEPGKQPMSGRSWWLVFALGCTGATTSSATAPSVISGIDRRNVEIEHEPCDLASSEAQPFDADNDGRPEVITVFSGGRPLCKAVDINLDGTIDVFAYFDSNGQMRRRESGFDRDTLPDEVAYFENGQLVRKERETNNDRKIDTWDYYQGGRLVREERDSGGDGYVNQWWAFTRPDNLACAIVLTDGDNDGRPDPNSQVDLCAEDDAGAKSALATKPKPAASAAPAESAAPPATSAPTDTKEVP